MADEKKFLLRLKPELWNELQAWAGDEMRSVNGQIEYLLREAVRLRRKKNLPDDMPSPAPQPPVGPEDAPGAEEATNPEEAS